ncbi:MAG: Gfo/Idh/MocA family oxidoreductase, partial [Clostridia bacterium]|nr:Gfo/Idh/MocA family oxidoreductase [Clostridia bacterium]
MKQVKIGVFGGGRGISMVEFCTKYSEAKLVAICDKSQEVMDNVKEFITKANEKNEIKTEVNYYYDFEEFIKEDMDAVILANYATEHAPFAVRCLERGLHVLSDIAPVKNLAEAVQLVEAVEKSGKIYAFGENCCFFPGVMEMRRNFRAGKYGKFLYGECEYIHDCSHIWPQITYGDRDHWRNRMYATFYCTHSIGPMIHITGERPKYVVGYELQQSPRLLDLGYLKGTAGIEMITTESGAVIKSMH